MKLNFSKESFLSENNTEDKNEFNKVFIKNCEKYANERLKNDGYFFLNDLLDALGLKKTKRGQFDGWIYDELDSEYKHEVQIKIKEENGEIIINTNEEKDIIDYVFKD